MRGNSLQKLCNCRMTSLNYWKKQNKHLRILYPVNVRKGQRWRNHISQFQSTVTKKKKKATVTKAADRHKDKWNRQSPDINPHIYEQLIF